jgi:UDP:flavonoid glycosyltransferase YjiC (YdhE family)
MDAVTIKSLEVELCELEAQAEIHLRESERLGDVADKIRAVLQAISKETHANTSDEEAHATNGSGLNLAELLNSTYSMLKVAGEPLSKIHIMERLRARGKTLPDEIVFGLALARDSRFEGVSRGRGAKWKLSE